MTGLASRLRRLPGKKKRKAEVHAVSVCLSFSPFFFFCLHFQDGGGEKSAVASNTREHLATASELLGLSIEVSLKLEFKLSAAVIFERHLYLSVHLSIYFSSSHSRSSLSICLYISPAVIVGAVLNEHDRSEKKRQPPG